jgi:hypothetical protein
MINEDLDKQIKRKQEENQITNHKLEEEQKKLRYSRKN